MAPPLAGGFAPIEGAPRYTPPPPPPARKSKKGIVIALVSVGVIAAIVAALLFIPAKSETTTKVEPVSPETTREDSTPDTTERGTIPATTDLDKFVVEAVAFVEKARELKFKTAPKVIALEEKEFVARFQELTEQDAAKHKQLYDDTTSLYQSLGLLKTNQTYLEAVKALGEGGVLGYYDPETGELRVRAGKLTPLARTVIVHELVHALDDQHFDLDRPEYDDADDEIGFGLTALAEGNARRVEQQYRDTMTDRERAAADAEEATLGGSEALFKLPLEFLQLIIAPYDLGEFFVGELEAGGGEAAINKAFSDVPRTSEQVINPQKYTKREVRVDVTPPAADGTVFMDGVIGQLVIQTLLGGNAAAAKTAAEGWSGDWFVAWRSGDKACIRAAFVMDTAKDRAELADAFNTWARRRPSGKVATVGERVEITSCNK